EVGVAGAGDEEDGGGAELIGGIIEGDGLPVEGFVEFVGEPVGEVGVVVGVIVPAAGVFELGEDDGVAAAGEGEQGAGGGVDVGVAFHGGLLGLDPGAVVALVFEDFAGDG